MNEVIDYSNVVTKLLEHGYIQKEKNDFKSCEISYFEKRIKDHKLECAISHHKYFESFNENIYISFSLYKTITGEYGDTGHIDFVYHLNVTNSRMKTFSLHDLRRIDKRVMEVIKLAELISE